MKCYHIRKLFWKMQCSFAAGEVGLHIYMEDIKL